jgi:ferrous iron transport protein B
MAVFTRESGTLRVALAGNPNSGKTSLFNALTGAGERVGNYPGVTVEKKLARYRDNGHEVEVVDLPGVYSLSAFSPEERVAREEILNGGIDVVVVVVDATNLERSLYLFVQALESGANAVLALNMSDEAEEAGQRLDLRQMRALLGTPIVETVGHKNRGVAELRQAIREAARRPNRGGRVIYGEPLEALIETISARLLRSLPCGAPPARWLALKFLEDDPDVTKWLAGCAPDAEQALADARRAAAPILTERNVDGPLLVADARYAFIAGLLREVRLSEMNRDARRSSEAADTVLCHRYFGIPIFLAIMYVLFWVTFRGGEPLTRLLEAGFAHLGAAVGGLWGDAVSPLRSLLVDGVIGGVGGVLAFIPNIVVLFLGLSLLEDTGYLARAAFLTDRFMHRLGLHGKSFVPLLTGFGCSVPGLLACRTLDNDRDRLTTMLVLPLMSCGARLPIYLLLVPAFFARGWRAPVMWAIYLLGIVLAVALAKLLRATILAGEDAPFVMELPPYRLPTVRSVARRTWQRALAYLRKAGTFILAASILMWAAATYPRLPASSAVSVGAVREPPAPVAVAAAQLEYSAMGRLGKALAPAASMMGADWRVASAMIGALAGKELFVAQLGVVFSMAEEARHADGLRVKLRAAYTPLQAFCFMVFLLIAAPCLATLIVMRNESGSWKWAALQFGGLTLLGWLLATAIYQVGRVVV